MQALVELDFLLIGSCLVSLCNGMVNGAFQIYLSHFPAMMATGSSGMPQHIARTDCWWNRWI